jgi:hypothetical protein
VFTWNTLTNAAREAARVGAVNQLDPVGGPYNCRTNYPIEDPATPGWTTRGCALSSGKAIGLAGDDVTITYAAPPDTDLKCTGTLNVDCLVTVTVQTQFTPITPVAGQLIGPISMSATSTMPIERLFPECPTRESRGPACSRSGSFGSSGSDATASPARRWSSWSG